LIKVLFSYNECGDDDYRDYYSDNYDNYVEYFIRMTDFKFILNDDFTIFGECCGAFLFTPSNDIFSTDPKQEFTENFIFKNGYLENTHLRDESLYVLEKYGKNIYMTIMRIYFDGKINVRNKFEMIETKLSEPLHIHIKYNNGQFDYSITSAPLSRPNIKPALSESIDVN
jgi:hypothetical protein